MYLREVNTDPSTPVPETARVEPGSEAEALEFFRQWPPLSALTQQQATAAQTAPASSRPLPSAAPEVWLAGSLAGRYSWEPGVPPDRLYCLFSSPQVALGEFQARDPELLVIEPGVSGQLAWIEPACLVFAASSAWPVGEYQLRVAGHRYRLQVSENGGRVRPL
jgi:hypothetical protein